MLSIIIVIFLETFQSAAEESHRYVVDGEVANELPQAINSLNCNLLTLNNDGHWDDFISGKGVIVLLSFSLIKKESAEILSFHPLVHSWSREQLSLCEQQRMYEIGSMVLSCAIPKRFMSYDYALRQLIFPHIKAKSRSHRTIRCVKK